MSIKQDLTAFYDSEAGKYASTRQKHRADAQIILEEIKKIGKKTISILEFGCGSGRFLNHLQTLKWIKINYTGVDISNELLKIAKRDSKNYKLSTINYTLIHDDIIHYIRSCKQESFDLVIGIASFQHIPTIKERYFLIKNIYRILKYEGRLIMNNRALSKRFLRTYRNQVLRSFFTYLITLGKHDSRDILVPRFSTNAKNSSLETRPSSLKTFRFYHLFSLKELQKLADAGGFIIDNLTYLDRNGQSTSKRTQANNSLFIAQKQIFTEAE